MNDLISRQAAIDAICKACSMTEDFDYHKCYGYPETSTLCDELVALRALPPAQPERTDCEYCHEDIDGYVKPIEKNCHAFIRFGMNGWELNLRAKGWHGEVKIKYCPICGRRLEL